MRSESLGGDVSDGSTTVAGDRAHSNSKWRLGTRSTWQPGGGIYIRHTHSSSTPGARVAGRTGRAESSQPRLSPGILPAQVYWAGRPRCDPKARLLVYDRGDRRSRERLQVEVQVVQRPDCIRAPAAARTSDARRRARRAYTRYAGGCSSTYAVHARRYQNSPSH